MLFSINRGGLRNIMDKFEKAFSYHNAGLLTEAKDLYLEILQEDKTNAKVWNLLGMVYVQTNEYLEAETCLKKAIDLEPKLFYLENLAKLYLQKGDFETSASIYEVLLKNRTEKYEYWFNLGLAYKNLKQWEKSKEAYLKSIEINPQSHKSYYNLAYLYLNDDNVPEALKCYQKALQIKPNDSETEYALSLAYMQLKDYKNGLKHFETRLCRTSSIISQQKTYPNLMNEKPLWQGENLKDKTLYTYYEAGFGDVLMFYRYMPLLTSMCKKVIFKPQKELAPLFRENSYGAEIMELYDLESTLDFDYHIPFLSVPYVLKAFDNNMFIHHDDGYIKPNPAKINYYKERFFQNDKFKIGIKWQGNAFYDKERILSVEDFFDLFEIKNTQFYSCQTLDGAQEFNKIKDRYNVIDLGSTFSNFSDTAGALSNMDLIICNDTSLAHLAGAMNKRCWVLLPHVYNWRWHCDLTKCDWYDSVKIFRQPQNDDWKTVFKNVKSELISLQN